MWFSALVIMRISENIHWFLFLFYSRLRSENEDSNDKKSEMV